MVSTPLRAAHCWYPITARSFYARYFVRVAAVTEVGEGHLSAASLGVHCSSPRVNRRRSAGGVAFPAPWTGPWPKSARRAGPGSGESPRHGAPRAQAPQQALVHILIPVRMLKLKMTSYPYPYTRYVSISYPYLPQLQDESQSRRD